MAAVETLAVQRFTNTVEHTGADLLNNDDWFQVPAHSGEFTFVVDVPTGATCTLTLQGGLSDNTTWYDLEDGDSIAITESGIYSYSYTGTPASLVRIFVDAVTLPEPEPPEEPGEGEPEPEPAPVVGIKPTIIIAYKG